MAGSGGDVANGAGSGGGDGAADPRPAYGHAGAIAAPLDEAGGPLQPPSRGGLRCSGCAVELPGNCNLFSPGNLNMFSKVQLIQGKARRCKACVASSGGDGGGGDGGGGGGGLLQAAKPEWDTKAVWGRQLVRPPQPLPRKSHRQKLICERES